MWGGFVVVIVCCSLVNIKLGKIIWFGKPVLVSLYRLLTAALALADALAVDEVLNRNKREATVHAVYLELHIKVVHSLYST